MTMDELLARPGGRLRRAPKPCARALLNKTPKYGNDDDRGRRAHAPGASTPSSTRSTAGPTGAAARYHINMLPTTCHVYFGSVIGATPDGRTAGAPLSEGISPVQGADRQGPTAVHALGGQDGPPAHRRHPAEREVHARSCSTGDEGLDSLAGLVRGYFRQDAHHVQFNVVTAETLREAQERPGQRTAT